MDQVEELAGIYKALSDPTRLRLIELLSTHKGALCVNALARKVGVTQSAVSQHLRVLRQAGLVAGVRHGYHVHYTLNSDRLAQYRAQVLETLGSDFIMVA
jgi:DNA-binding transcriptional ArsR family regulator